MFAQKSRGRRNISMPGRLRVYLFRKYKICWLQQVCRVPQQQRQPCVCVWPNCLFNHSIFHFSIHTSIVYPMIRQYYENKRRVSNVLPTENACHTSPRRSFAFCDQLWSKYQWDHFFFLDFLSVVSLQALIEFRSMQTMCRHRSNDELLWLNACTSLLLEWLINQRLLFIRIKMLIHFGRCCYNTHAPNGQCKATEERWNTFIE